MEIRVNTFGHARGRRFIFRSPAPPLPCEFPRWQSKGAYLWGCAHGNKGTAPSVIICASKPWLWWEELQVAALCLPKRGGQVISQAGALVLKAASMLWGQVWCQNTLGKLGSAP